MESESEHFLYNHRRLFESGNRDFTIDAIVATIVVVVLLLGILLCGFYTFSYKSTMIQPEMNVRDAYIKATIIFARLFQQPRKRNNFSMFTRPLVSNKPYFRLNKPINADSARKSRNMGDSSFAFDLTNETSIFYSGTLFKFSNNIVAQNSHLEYCFDPIMPPAPVDSPRTLNLKLAYLPSIKESKSMESLSSISAYSPRDNFIRPRIKREILLFTGPEHRREWLAEESGEDEPDNEFHWAFEEVSSAEEDASIKDMPLPPVPSVVQRLTRK